MFRKIDRKVIALALGLMLSSSQVARAQTDAYAVTPAGWAAANIIDALKVTTNPRYQPANGNTYCNLFVSDATRNLGWQVPIWTAQRGWLTANTQQDWLLNEGRLIGWWETNEFSAQYYGNNGYIVVASWRNPFGHGHTAMIRPFTSGTTVLNNKRIGLVGPRITQAGAWNYSSADLATGFGANWSTKPVRFFVHRR